MDESSGASTAQQVIIIGAGPAGLAIGAELRRHKQPFVILEKEHNVGASWRKHYKRLHLHTVKEYSHLPGMPFPGHYPRYVSRDQLLAYFEDYARHFELQPIYAQSVYHISKLPNGQWQVNTSAGQSHQAAAVVLATGINRVPYWPRLNGQEHFQGTLIHSSEYHDPEPFRGKRVLVVGMGNSGAEIALDLSEAGVPTYLSVRGPVNIVPREVLGRPTQVTAFALAKLPHWLGDRIGLWVRRLTVGDMPRYGLPLSPLAPARQLRETGQTPVIDLGTLNEIRAGRIKVLPGIDHFHDNGVVFKNGEEQAFDAIILATGYRPKLEDFMEHTEQLTDDYGLPRGIAGQGTFQGLYFIGFDNYSPGGGLGVIRRDAERIASLINEAAR